MEEHATEYPFGQTPGEQVAERSYPEGKQSEMLGNANQHVGERQVPPVS
jgi:hypothetical protein